MDLKEQIIAEYLTQGGDFRKLAAKYGISRTIICKWVIIHEGIPNMPPTEKQNHHKMPAYKNIFLAVRCKEIFC